MTQPAEAVGGADDPVIAARPTLEDRLSAALNGDDHDQEQEHPGEAEAEVPGPELTPEDVVDEGAEEPEAEASEEADLPPIKPPVSWTTEEQEEFRQLPRALQETLTRRESERERFVQTKAHEARQARTQVESEAVAAFRQLQGNFAAQIQTLLPPIPQRPSHKLQADDPWAYAEQMDAWERSVAQHQWAQQQLQAIQQHRAASEQAERQQAFQREQDALRDTLPEWFDATEGPKLHARMKSIAHDLGYSAEQLHDATATEVLALKKVSELKAKADKYDTLMAKKLEQVRAARGLPRVSKPGVPQGKAQIAGQRYTADRQAMRQGDRGAALRVFADL